VGARGFEVFWEGIPILQVVFGSSVENRLRWGKTRYAALVDSTSPMVQGGRCKKKPWYQSFHEVRGLGSLCVIRQSSDGFHNS